MVLAEGRQVQLPNLSLARSGGTPAQVVLHLGLITRDGNPAQLIGQIIDRTDEIRAHDAARRMQDEIAHVARLTTLGEMASAISHEINQPLTAIATQAQAYRRLMNNSQTSPEEIAAGLDTIVEQALRIGQVIKRVRAFVTRRESARERVDVNETVSQVLDLAQVDARKAQILLKIDLAPELPVVIGDSVQIQQVVLNLLRNAIDASLTLDDPRRIIVIASRAQTGGISIRVIDRGPGVPREQQAQLFLPFFTTKADGVGMGLSISHSIMNAHGGTLRYVANPEGGSIFEIWLPAADPVVAAHAGIEPE
jgi:C4-dicarboxylate-specific signal transduction histidine kinase